MLERNVTVRGRLLTSRLTPLFPGYLFIRTLSEQWRFLLGTFGLVSIIMAGEHPATLSQDIVDDIKQREAEGAIQLPDASRLFDAKDPVRVADGPFEGRHGLVAGYSEHERVQVLLDLLGRKVSVLFAEGQLEAA